MEMGKFNEESFKKTELGKKIEELLLTLEIKKKELDVYATFHQRESFRKTIHEIDTILSQWLICRIALQQFYGIDCHYTETEDYFGIINHTTGRFLFEFNKMEQEEILRGSLTEEDMPHDSID